MDSVLPEINITNPVGDLDYIRIGDNETLEYNISDANLDSCWYEYNETNVTFNCSENQTNFTYIPGQNNLTVYANDTFGNLNSEITQWDYKVLENSLTYNNKTLAGSQEEF